MVKILLLFVVLGCCLFTAEQTELSLPISEELFCKLSLSMKRLQKALAFFDTRYQNKLVLWKRTQLTKKYLNELNYEMNKYNNVILGSGNKASGNKNVIVGNYNNIEGSNNWVFISQFKGKINGDLLISEWRVEIDKADQILINPRYAISFLDQSKNKPIQQKAGYKHNRKACKWNDWAQPSNERTYELWNKYYGFDKFANQYNRHHTSWSSSGRDSNRHLNREQDSSSSRQRRQRNESSLRYRRERQSSSSSGQRIRSQRRNRDSHY